LLFAAALASRDGRLVQRDVVPVMVELPPRSGAKLRRRLVRRLAGHPAVQRAICRELQQRADTSQAPVSTFAAALEQRVAECHASFEHDNDALRWQGSLFDRRAEQQAGLRDSQRSRLHAWLERKRASARAMTALRHTPPRLLAAWLAR
jgi:hypothetical protein